VKYSNFDFLCLDIKRVLRSIQYMKSKKMTEYGLKGSTAQCLCHIAGNATGLNAGEISGQLNIDKAQVSRCMAELAEKGYVFRNEQEGKRYRQKYCLTSEGRVVVEDIIQTSLDIRNRISAGISEQDEQAFYRVLEIMCRNSADFPVGEE